MGEDARRLWGIQIRLQPAGALTFRCLPGGILHIMSYPFLPPTTMSGFLARLLHLRAGADWPNYGELWFRGAAKPKKAGKEYTLTLPPSLRPLGAFPQTYSIHTAYRHGPKDFQHTMFSQLSVDKSRDYKRQINFQLHQWDYLFVDQLTGWVLAQEREALTCLQELQNYGGKIGKEGYAYVAQISDIIELPLRQGEYRPVGLVPTSAKPCGGIYYRLYAHHWNKGYRWPNGQKGGVDGFIHLGAWWQVPSLCGQYWAIQTATGLPYEIVDCFLQGDVAKWAGE